MPIITLATTVVVPFLLAFSSFSRPSDGMFSLPDSKASTLLRFPRGKAIQDPVLLLGYHQFRLFHSQQHLPAQIPNLRFLQQWDLPYWDFPAECAHFHLQDPWMEFLPQEYPDYPPDPHQVEMFQWLFLYAHLDQVQALWVRHLPAEDRRFLHR